MRSSVFRHIIVAIMVYTLIAGCAKVSSPSGGPRDKQPPVVTITEPLDRSCNFKGNKIEITFDEYVDLDKINEKFMVSPPMKERPDISIRGKSVVVEYDEELKDSTTYTLNFQDAVKDLNEGNVYDNLQFVFSTGPVVDSLSVTGNVYNAFALDIPENPLILLYRNLAPEAFTDSLPDYISRARNNGYFRVDNIKPGKYRLYALLEKDNSRNFNLPDEQIAFLNDTVEVTPEKNYLPVKRDTVIMTKPKIKDTDTVTITGEYKLIMFQQDRTIHYLTSSSRSLPYLLMYTLSLPPKKKRFSFSIPGASDDLYLTERTMNNDTLRVWLRDSTLLSSQLITTLIDYPFTDSTGAIIEKADTVKMRFTPPKSSRAKTKPEAYSVRTNLTSGPLRPDDKFIFLSSTPFVSPDTSLIRLYEIKGTEKTNIPYQFTKDSINLRRLILETKLEFGKNYLFIADSAAFGDIYGEVSDSAGYKISVKKEESFGQLALTIKGHKGSRIIQLLDKDEKVIRQKSMSKDGKAEFKLLDKGIYKARVIYDLNKDGKWTNGDYSRKRQPEPVSFYPHELEVKEGWVVDQDWDITVMNVKKLKNIPRPGQGK